MRLQSLLEITIDHEDYINVGDDDHHDAPEHLETSNTSLSVPGLLVGPVNWDISVPDWVTVAAITLRSNNTTGLGGGKGGALVIATSNQFAATGMTLGGHGSIGTTSYNMIYSKAASAINLTDKMFSSAGLDVALSQAYLTGGAGSRVLRLEWTNYNLGAQTLNVYVEVSLIG
jgi:hypothetical protein